ncbi:hypothetical protein C8J57DRAFT_591024 [Mycena rebaudengoi]|nr:hypothetical protein C8J57DRAFT_591024 [Mycena rebaudengoi]
MRTSRFTYHSMRQEDMYRIPGFMVPRTRTSPVSEPERDALSSASSYSSSSSPYDSRFPLYRPSSAPHLGGGVYRPTTTQRSGVSNQFYPTRAPSSAARHQCTYCNKRFNRPSGLKIHLTTHTGDKPFICPEESCGRSFSVRSNMRRHVRIVHQLAREGSEGSGAHSPQGEPRALSES